MDTFKKMMLGGGALSGFHRYWKITTYSTDSTDPYFMGELELLEETGGYTTAEVDPDNIILGITPVSNGWTNRDRATDGDLDTVNHAATNETDFIGSSDWVYDLGVGVEKQAKYARISAVYFLSHTEITSVSYSDDGVAWVDSKNIDYNGAATSGEFSTLNYLNITW